MKVLISTVCLALAIAVFADETFNLKDISEYSYHTRIGIPAADKIRKSEKRMIKIVGGTVTDVKYTPYQAGLVIEIAAMMTSVCGGSLISATRVLTAAHCKNDGWFTATTFTVVLGSNTLFSGGLRIVTDDIVMHPRWNPATVSNDIAVIRVKPITFTNVIQPIKLPTLKDIQNDFVGYNAVASGFGVNVDGKYRPLFFDQYLYQGGSISDDQQLSSVTMPVISNKECATVNSQFITSSIICTSGAGGKGACGGDSGGPLAVHISGKPVLIGLSSFGSAGSCSRGLPSAFTRITSFMSWIQSN